MPLPVIAGTTRCSVQGTTPSGRPWANVLHIRKAAGAAWITADYTTVGLHIQKLYLGPIYTAGAYLMQYCKTTCTTQQIVFTPLDGSGVSNIYAMNGAGAATTNSAPSEVSIVTTLRTALRGRRYRGRVFMPPHGVDTFNADGSIGAARITALLNQWIGFQAALGGSSFTQVVASYLYSIATDINAYTIDTKADVIRARK